MSAALLTTGHLSLSAAQNIGLNGATATGQGTRGADITNNVTSGGSSDVIADFTDLNAYLNDAPTIRNNFYQITRALKQINDYLRLRGDMS